MSVICRCLSLKRLRRGTAFWNPELGDPEGESGPTKKLIKPYGGYASAKDRKGDVYAYPVLILATSKAAAIEKETPFAQERFPEDEYGAFEIFLAGPE